MMAWMVSHSSDQSCGDSENIVEGFNCCFYPDELKLDKTDVGEAFDTAVKKFYKVWKPQVLEAVKAVVVCD